MTRPATLSSCTWPELENSATTLLVAVGSLEQHGPHLPLDTDTRIASAVVARVHANLDDPSTLIAPPLGYGASGEHEGFPGTISLGHDALRGVLVEYGRSACRWAQRIVFVNGHGGNASTLVDAIGLLRYEGRDVAWYPCAFDGADAHAGTTETSVLLHLSPDSVRRDSVVVGNREPVATLLPAMRDGGVASVSANGVLGDPTTASANEGAALVDGLVSRLGAAIREWDVAENGRLR
ncbi:mycofactocin biosynthesis peptidyl-dipeptidase MftE [Gordonia sp. w5E2]|uniref:Creatininase n=1 Tax=Gordonia jacobaea TaxID=122202 RepID=A0ABR5ICQ2_9ACTN|nr:MULTISPECIES: mycofactocin biosynthesis peptidyl-dipeptidase MftE [Gordonia]KNA91487.1 creatininase [Gordonia jacobaea]